jgi:hypothetical protein
MDIVRNVRSAPQANRLRGNINDGDRRFWRYTCHASPVIAVDHKIADDRNLLTLEVLEEFLQPMIGKRDDGKLLFSV